MITITSTFCENGGKHSVSETFKCDGITETKDALLDILDLTFEKDRTPVKPDHAVVRKNLEKFADDEFIENELTRLTNAWNVYCHVMEYLSIPHKEFLQLSVDKNTKLTIIVED